MRKFDIQDRVILDDALDSFMEQAKEHEELAKEVGNRPIVTYQYWEMMMEVVQEKVDAMTTKKALYHSKKYR